MTDVNSLNDYHTTFKTVTTWLRKDYILIAAVLFIVPLALFGTVVATNTYSKVLQIQQLIVSTVEANQVNLKQLDMLTVNVKKELNLLDTRTARFDKLESELKKEFEVLMVNHQNLVELNAKLTLILQKMKETK